MLEQFDLLGRLGDLPLNELDVLNLGAGTCSSPISKQFQEMDCRSLTNVEVWDAYFNTLSGLKFKTPVTNVHENLMPYILAQADKSTDVIIMLDVIEHLAKDPAWIVVHELFRVARQRVVLFLPIGVTPQEDLDGNEYQRHLSTWYLSDLPLLSTRCQRMSIKWYKEFHTHVKPAADAAWVVCDL